VLKGIIVTAGFVLVCGVCMCNIVVICIIV